MSDDGNDFLAHCVARLGENPLLEQIRERGSDIMVAVYRLLKITLVHAVENDVVQEASQQVVQILQGVSQRVGSGVTITFADDTVFVCAQLLRASRKVYDVATELGQLLQRCGISQVAFAPDVTQRDLLAFAKAFSLAVRDPNRREALLETDLGTVTLRHVEARLTARQHEEELPLHEQVLRLYAAGLVVMQNYLDAVAGGQMALPHRVKRLAQRLVALSETGHPALLGMTAMANAHRHDAGRAMQSAILALAVARQVTRDRVVLARLCMSALLADVGRVRLAGPEGRDRLVKLADQLESKVPAAAALVSVAGTGINPQGALRTVTLFESSWLERQQTFGPVYRGKEAPLKQAEVLFMVRLLLECLAPRDASRAQSPGVALQILAQDPAVDRDLLKLLIRAVGLIPTTSVVELNTGEWAVVIGPSGNPRAFPAPTVRVVTDRTGRSLERPLTLDLGDPACGAVRVARLIEADQARFNVTRAFLE